MCAVPEHGAPPFDFATLHRAFLDCRRGKGNSPARWQFEARLKRNLVDLADELRSHRYRPAPSVCFVSDQPKRREIFAAAFRDRVVHHLLVRQIEPYWEARFIHDSYACRRGKGTLAAVDRVQRFIRQVSANGSRRAWYLHLDVRSFFVRIDKRILLSLLERGVERQALPWADEIIWLLRTIVLRDPARDAHRIGRGFNAVPAHKSLYHTGNVTGLPIGNYSSQFFANVYLDRLDQFVKHDLKQPHYLRYVDDLLLLDTDRERLLACEAAIDAFLHRELELELNTNARRLAPVSNGIDALGYVVHRDHRLLRRRTLRRFQRLLDLAREHMAGTAKTMGLSDEGSASSVSPAGSLHDRDRRGSRCAPHRAAPDTGRGQAVLRLAPLRCERLLAACMSYRGLLRHANSQRAMVRLQAEHGWIGWLWRLSPRGRVRRRLRIMAAPTRLAGQWRELKRRWPGARLLLQVGAYWEAFRGDAHWLRAQLGLQSGRGRAGLGCGAGFRCRDASKLRRLADGVDQPLVLLRETGRRSGAVCERVVCRVLLPMGWDVSTATSAVWLAPGWNGRTTSLTRRQAAARRSGTRSGTPTDFGKSE